MVMGGDSCSKGRGFDSQRRMLDGQIFTFIHCKNSLFENTKINEKRPEMDHFLKNLRRSYWRLDCMTHTWLVRPIRIIIEPPFVLASKQSDQILN